jgi:leucyl aminopeptidase (aminopeptidase T)
MLAGQVTWEPNEASMEGVLVADGILSPPEEVGLIAEPVRFSTSPAGASPPSTAGGRRRC